MIGFKPNISKILFLLIVFCLTCPSFSYAKKKIPLDLEGELSKNSQGLKNIKIGFVPFFPLPSELPDNFVLHSLVFTNEFYSNKPGDNRFSGIFIPKDYLKIIFCNIEILKRRHQLQITTVENIAELSDDTDYIIIASVKEFWASKRETKVSYDVLLLSGKTIGPVKRKTITKTINRYAPFKINEPFHLIGSHKINFRQQRYMLNLVTYMVLAELINFISGEIK